MASKSFYGSSRIRKIFLNNEKIKRGYINNKRVFSASNPVTYVIDSNWVETEEVDYEASCLNPSFTPSKTGWTFIGWKENSTADGNVLQNKIMRDNPITLYAVFRQTITLTLYNGDGVNYISDFRYYNNENYNNPIIDYSHANMPGWDNNGWTLSTSNLSPDFYDGRSTFEQNTTYYALYNQQVYLTVHDSKQGFTEMYYRNINCFNRNDIKNPSVQLINNGVEGWIDSGFTTDTSLFDTIIGNKGFVELNYNKTFYGFYRKEVNMYKYNGSTIAEKDTLYKGAIYTGEVIPNFSYPTFFLKQVSIGDGWIKKGWTTDFDGFSATHSDGDVTLSEDTSFCSLYEKDDFTFIVYNGSTQPSITGCPRLMNYHNTITFSYTSVYVREVDYTGDRLTPIGWTWDPNSFDVKVPSTDLNVTVTSSMTYYSIYKREVVVTKYDPDTKPGYLSGYGLLMYTGDGEKKTSAAIMLHQNFYYDWIPRGWSFSSSPNAEISYISDTTSYFDDDVTIYSSYYKPCYLDYWGNGGLTSDGSSTVIDEKIAYMNYNGEISKAVFTVGGNPFIYGGYTFNGWSNSSSSTSGNTPIGGTISTSETYSNLYATWKEDVVNILAGGWAPYNWNNGGSTLCSYQLNRLVADKDVELKVSGYSVLGAEDYYASCYANSGVYRNTNNRILNYSFTVKNVSGYLSSGASYDIFVTDGDNNRIATLGKGSVTSNGGVNVVSGTWRITSDVIVVRMALTTIGGQAGSGNKTANIVATDVRITG